MDTTKQYIKNVIKAVYPALDISEGSPLSELFVNPSSAILDPVLTQLKYLLDNMGLSNPDTIDSAELDNIASNFLIFRNLGTPSTGYVECFYDTAQSLSIPIGTQFSTVDGTIFLTTTSIQISNTSMLMNTWRYPLYSTGLVPVMAETTSITAIGPEEIVDTNMVPTPVLVTNSTGFTPSTTTETNAELAARILKTVLNRSLGSANSINVFLTENFPSIRSTLVMGPSDVRMTRDLFESGIASIQNYHVVDFCGKVGLAVNALDVIANFDEYPYPQSKAFWTLFYDDPATSGITQDLPQPDEFLLEFSTEQYASLYYLNDALKTTISTTTIMDEPFNNTFFNSNWVRGDTHLGTAVTKNVYEIFATINGARLGYTPDVAALYAMPLSVNRSFLKQVKDAIGIAMTLTRANIDLYNPDQIGVITEGDLERIW